MNLPRLTKQFASAVLLTMSASALSYAQTADDIIISDAWVREGPPSATVLAGYLSIKNSSKDTDYVLEGVDSPQFTVSEMHESYEENGTSRMRRHEQLIVPPQGELHLTPSGFHLMLMDPPQPVRAGQSIDLRLKFKNLAPIAVKAAVKRVID